MYSVVTVDNEQINRAKGIAKNISHREYIDVLFNKKKNDNIKNEKK